MKTKKRPWQGTVLFVADVISAISGIIIVICYFWMTSLVSFPNTPTPFSGVISNMFIGLIIFYLSGSVLLMIAARGILKGQEWAVITNLVICIFSVFGSITAITNNDIKDYIILAFSLFLGYCSLACLKNDFYKKPV